MFEAYQVAVKISLVNHVSAGLLMMSKQFASTSVQATALQKRIESIHLLARNGAMWFGAGGAMAAPFIYAIDKAAALQKEMIGIQSATHGSVREMDGMRKSIEAIAGRTVFSNIDVAKMAKTISTGTTFSADQVSKVLPAYARFADVQMMMKGTSYQQSIPELIRLAHTAQKYTPEAIAAYGDLLTKASFVVPGSLSEIGNALKYSQGLGKQVLGVDDDSMVLTTALLNQMGIKGSRGGTNLIAAMTRTIPGIFGSGLLEGKSNEALRAMGMVDDKGHSKVFKNGKFDVFTWLGLLSEYTSREMATNPEAIARQNIMKNMQHAFGAQGGRVASLLANPQAIELLGLIGQRFAGAGGVEAIQNKFADEAVAQQWMNAKTNFVSAMTELGYTLLPLATVALRKLNSGLQTLISWITDHPDAARRLAESFLALSGAMMLSGSIMMLTAGFRGLGLVLGIGSGVVGNVGLLGAVSGLLGPIGLAVAAIGLLAATIGILSPDDKNQPKAGHHWVPGHGPRGSGGHWEPDSPADAHTPHGSFSRHSYESPHIRRGDPSGGTVHTAIHLDGKKIATAMTPYIAAPLGMGMSGGGSDYGLALPMPAVG